MKVTHKVKTGLREAAKRPFKNNFVNYIHSHYYCVMGLFVWIYDMSIKELAIMQGESHLWDRFICKNLPKRSVKVKPEHESKAKVFMQSTGAGVFRYSTATSTKIMLIHILGLWATIFIFNSDTWNQFTKRNLILPWNRGIFRVISNHTQAKLHPQTQLASPLPRGCSLIKPH